MVAAGPLADHGERLTAAGLAGRVERHRDRDARVQVGAADSSGPVAVDGGQVMVEVAVPAAARAVIGDPPGQPVPLQGTDQVFGMQDQPGQPVPPQDVVGGRGLAPWPGARRGRAAMIASGAVPVLLPAHIGVSQTSQFTTQSGLCRRPEGQPNCAGVGLSAITPAPPVLGFHNTGVYLPSQRHWRTNRRVSSGGTSAKESTCPSCALILCRV